MVLANVIVFPLWKISHNLVHMRKSLFANNCWSKQDNEKCPIWETFAFIQLSETSSSFVKIGLVQEIESVYSLIKTHFYWK